MDWTLVVCAGASPRNKEDWRHDKAGAWCRLPVAQPTRRSKHQVADLNDDGTHLGRSRLSRQKICREYGPVRPLNHDSEFKYRIVRVATPP